MLPKFFVLRLTGKLQNLSAFNCLFYMQYIIAAGTIFIFALYCIKFCFEQKECSGGGQATTPPPSAPCSCSNALVLRVHHLFRKSLYKRAVREVVNTICYWFIL